MFKTQVVGDSTSSSCLKKSYQIVVTAAADWRSVLRVIPKRRRERLIILQVIRLPVQDAGRGGVVVVMVEGSQFDGSVKKCVDFCTRCFCSECHPSRSTLR